MHPDPLASSPDEIRDLLARSAGVLSAPAAGAVRDWVARRVLSDPQTAADIANLLRDACDAMGSKEIRAIGWRCSGDAAIYQGRLHDARDAYERASQLARGAGAVGLLGQILVSQISVLSTQGRAEEAARLVAEAEAHLVEADDRPYLARLYMSLGNASFHRHDYQGAYEQFSRADREFRLLGATDGMTLGLRINLGVVAYTALSRVSEAREIFLAVERDCAGLGLRHLEAQAKFNRAHLETLWGNYREAISLLEAAEEMFVREQAPELLAATQLTRAEAFVDLGMPDEAVDLAGRAGDTYRSCELALDAAVADLALARALRSEGRTTETRRILERVRAFYDRADLPVGSALIDIEIARTIRAPGELDRAAELARGAIPPLLERGFVAAAVRGRIVLAETLRLARQLRPAEAELGPALDLVAQLSVRDRVDLWTVAARVARDADRRWCALRRYRRAVSDVERERHLTPGAELKARSFGTDANRELVDLLLEGRLGFENLFCLVESTHGRRWQGRGQPVDPEGAGAPEWTQRRAELAALLRQVQQREAEGITSTGSAAANLTALRREIVELESSILSGVRTAFFRTPVDPAAAGDRGGGAREVSASRRDLPGLERGGLDVRRIRAQLVPDQALVVLFATAEQLVAMAVSQGDTIYRRLSVGSGEVRRTLRDWHMQLESFALLAHRGQPNLEFHRPASDLLLERLGEDLLEPIRGELHGVRELFVVPHGFLHQVPFECLRLDGEYLADRCQVRRLPAAELLMAGARIAEPAASGGAASRTPQVAAPARSGVEPAPSGATAASDGGAATGPDVVLVARQNGPPGAEAEGRAVARVAGAELFVDPTAAEILEALEGARHVHWTTHGVLRHDNPLFSHLAARDGGLFLADLRGRRLAVKRLVLSACDTGNVVAGRSDDVAGVALAFLHAGVGELVAGLWRVHDEATVQFMEEFYRAGGVGAGISTAAALQRARVETRRLWDHPYYWGAFVVYG